MNARRLLLTRRPAAIAAGLLCAVLLLFAAPRALLAQTPTPIERMLPDAQSATVGETLTTAVTVEDVSHLGAYEVLITYDSALIGVTSATNGPFIGSSGRSVFCPAFVVTTITGTIRQVRFGCVTGGTLPPGPSGGGLLATITWQALAPGEATLDLAPSLSDELGTDIPAIAFDASVSIAGGPGATPTVTNTPCAGTCPTDTPTPTPTATATATATTVISCGSAVPVVCIEPQSAVVGRGTTFDVGVAARQMTGLAGFQFTLTYDPAVVTAVGASPGTFLASTGRTVQCLGPVLAPGSAQFTCITLADVPAPPNGSGILAFVNFTADLEGVTAMGLSAVTLSGLTGNVIAGTTAGGTRTVAPCDGPCPTPTSTPTATPTGTATNTATPTATATACGGPCPTATATHTPTATNTVAPTNTPGSPVPLTLRVTPASQTSTQDAGLFVEVAAEGVVDFGAYEIGITYDESLLTLTSVENGALLGSTGRTVSCPSFSPGLGSVRLGCVTLGNTPAGANGNGVLARFHFTGDAAGVSAINISSPIIAHPNGTTQQVFATVPGSVTIVPCDGPCPTPTATPTAGTPTATPGAGGAVFSMDPASTSAAVNDTITLQVRVANATNVGSYDLLLDYAYDDQGAFEPDVLEFVDFSDGGFLGSTGRPVTCLPPSLDLLSVRFGCVTSGPAPPGPGGAGVLATVRFRVLKQPFSPMVVRVSTSSGGTSDPAGDSQRFTTGAASTITITPPAGMIAAATLLPPNDAGRQHGGWALAARAATPVAGARGFFSAALLLVAMIIVMRSLLWLRLARRGALVAASCAGVSLLLIAGPYGQRASAIAPVEVFASPLSANAFLGGQPAQIEVRVVPIAAPGLGSFQLDATFNATLVSVSAAPGPFLGSTGNATSCTITYPSTSQIRLACAASGNPPAGPTGSGVIAVFAVQPRASLDLRAASNNGILTAVDLSGAIIRATDGVAMPVAGAIDAILAVRALEADVNRDCVVDVADEQLIASHLYLSSTMTGYDGSFNLEPEMADGDIGLQDLQFVLGRSGSTCAAPIAPQLPPAVPPIPDADADAIPDLVDNCPAASNFGQSNGDAANPALNRPGDDAAGDACDDDLDGDGRANTEETALGESPNTYCSVMRADVDADNAVSILDLAALAQHFGRTTPPAPDRYRQDADQFISILDLANVANSFQQSVSACP